MLQSKPEYHETLVAMQSLVEHFRARWAQDPTLNEAQFKRVQVTIFMLTKAFEAWRDVDQEQLEREASL